MRTAESVILTCWPPAPPDRNVSMRMIVELDVDLDFVIDLRIDEDRSERGMPPGVGIERRNSHQPVHADFGLQQPVRILAIDFESHRFDAGAFAFQAVGNHGVQTLALGPAQVHAQQHLRPILAFGAARAWVDDHHGVAPVVFAGEQHLGFELVQQFGIGLHAGGDFAFDRTRLREPIRITCRGRKSGRRFGGRYRSPLPDACDPSLPSDSSRDCSKSRDR